MLDGALAVEVSRDGADAQILEVIGPGSGMLSGRQLATARRATFLCALVPTTVVILSEREFGRVLESDVLLACSLANQLCERAAEMQERLSARNARDAHLRMGHCLLYLHDKLGSGLPGRARHSHTDLPVKHRRGCRARSPDGKPRPAGPADARRHPPRARSGVCPLSLRAGAPRVGRPAAARWRAAGNCQFVHPGTSLACRSLRPVPLARVSPKLRRFVDR